ncbi:LytR/AlgR family response regulator transcription factor [Flavihumibacter sp. UBA7668]|uniref:LytR/AlgR family response regulator transcription factor n=1 Tax=Flavihumibacter sp. UBA7668 TaxID=1946542 RepID=UPI0025C5A75B|nr:LytTR family DNA-binding domain-containing protein [Flavihumibacter sp. UBA7668]
MKILIIEDELPAAERLSEALFQLRNDLELLSILQTVKESVQWLKSHPHPDLIFMDIELTDGQSFHIFDEVKLDCPVIFCTAYDDYWQNAFEHNSIDYLLKPIAQVKLSAALQKYELLKAHFSNSFEQLQKFRKNPDQFKKRWLIKRGTDYIALKTEEIAFFYAAHKMVCLVDAGGQKYLLDKSLSDIERELNPAQFFRLNRQFLAHINSIKKLKSIGKGKLLVELHPAAPEDVLISSEQTAAFKEWLDA